MEFVIASIVVVLLVFVSYKIGAARISSFFFALRCDDGVHSSWVWIRDNDTNSAIDRAKQTCIEKSAETKKGWYILDMKKID